MKSIRIPVFVLLLAGMVLPMCRMADAAAKKNLSVAVFTNTSGLSSEERRLTLGLTYIASYHLESSMNLRLVPESDYSLLDGDPDAKLLFDGSKAESSRVASGLKADVLITGRIKKDGKSYAAEYRFYFADDKSLTMAKASFQLSGISAFQKKLTALLLDKAAVGTRITDNSYTSSAAALRSFCEGVALLSEGKTNEALKELGAASRADQSFRDYDYFMGQYYAVKKFDYEKAISHLGRITAKDKNDHSAHFWLGFTYYLKGDSALAIREFETAVKIKPFLPEAYA